MSLSPDDHQYSAVELPRRGEQPEQPYGIVAIMVGVIVLFAARLVARHWPMWPFWGAAALIASFVYNLLIILRPRLPLLLMTVVAAELGLLLSMPARALFFLPLSDPVELGRLISRMICVGAVGAFAAWVLSVERYPSLVIAINFLLMFVVEGLFYFVRLFLLVHYH